MPTDPAELEHAEAGAAAWPAITEERPLVLEGIREQTPGILRLAWPAILGNLGFSTVGLVDIKIVGALGPSAVAAVATGNRIFFVLQAVLMAVTAGTTAMVARAWGAGDRREAERVTQASMGVCCAVSAALTVPAVLYADALAGVFDLEPRALEQAASFIRVLSLFNVAFAANMVIGAAIRAAGDTMTPLWIGLLTNVVNIALVYGLVFGHFGLPALGVTGAGLASGLAFGCGAVVSVALWMAGGLRVKAGRKGAVFTARRVRQLFRIGYPAGLEQAAMQLGFVIFLFVVSLYGTAPYAAYGIGVQILSFSFVVGFGFTIAASTHVGQLLGAGEPEAATASGWRAVRLAIVSMVVLGGTIIVCADPIARFMIDDPEVVRLTVVFIYILGAMQPLMAIDFTLGGALRGAGDTRFPLLTTLTGLVLVRGSIAVLLAWLGLPVEWVFGALILDYVVKSGLLALRFRSGAWQRVEI